MTTNAVTKTEKGYESITRQLCIGVAVSRGIPKHGILDRDEPCHIIGLSTHTMIDAKYGKTDPHPSMARKHVTLAGSCTRTNRAVINRSRKLRQNTRRLTTLLWSDSIENKPCSESNRGAAGSSVTQKVKFPSHECNTTTRKYTYRWRHLHRRQHQNRTCSPAPFIPADWLRETTTCPTPRAAHPPIFRLSSPRHKHHPARRNKSHYAMQCPALVAPPVLASTPPWTRTASAAPGGRKERQAGRHVRREYQRRLHSVSNSAKKLRWRGGERGRSSEDCYTRLSSSTHN